MATIGARKQEQKLSEMAALAKELFPNIDELAVKGALRYGAKAALEKSRFATWAEVAEQPAATRKEFFSSLLREAKPHLSHIVGDGIDRFVREVQAANEKYLHT